MRRNNKCLAPIALALLAGWLLPACATSYRGIAKIDDHIYVAGSTWLKRCIENPKRKTELICVDMHLRDVKDYSETEDSP